MMKKTKNEKSSIFGTAREGMSSAESNPKERIYEVHSGVDSANKMCSRIRMAHVTCIE